MREALEERNSRISDSKQTHIVLGFHSVPKLSEKVSRNSPLHLSRLCLCYCVCAQRWQSLKGRGQWILDSLRLANPMDLHRDTLFSVTSEPLIISTDNWHH